MLKNPLDRSIGMLVISPTRELAAQIAEEAKQLTAFQQNFRVQVLSFRACSLPCQGVHCKGWEGLARKICCNTLIVEKHWDPDAAYLFPSATTSLNLAEDTTSGIAESAMVQVMFGGTNINKDVSSLNRGPPHILVGTPFSVSMQSLQEHHAIQGFGVPLLPAPRPL